MHYCVHPVHPQLFLRSHCTPSTLVHIDLIVEKRVQVCCVTASALILDQEREPPITKNDEGSRARPLRNLSFRGNGRLKSRHANYISSLPGDLSAASRPARKKRGRQKEKGTQNPIPAVHYFQRVSRPRNHTLGDLRTSAVTHFLVPPKNYCPLALLLTN